MIGQDELVNTVQYQLESELRQLPDLVLLLENVCTARDFLLKIGGTPEASLVEFMVELRLTLTTFQLICV